MHTIRNSLNTKAEQNKSQVYKSNTSLAYKIRISANSATDTISANMRKPTLLTTKQGLILNLYYCSVQNNDRSNFKPVYLDLWLSRKLT